MCVLTMGYNDLGTKILSSIFLVCFTLEIILNGMKNMHVVTYVPKKSIGKPVWEKYITRRFYYDKVNKKATLRLLDNDNVIHEFYIEQDSDDKKILKLRWLKSGTSIEVNNSGIDFNSSIVQNLGADIDAKTKFIDIKITLKFNDDKQKNYNNYKNERFVLS